MDKISDVLMDKVYEKINNASVGDVLKIAFVTVDLASKAGTKVVETMKETFDNISYERTETKIKKKKMKEKMQCMLELQLEESWEKNIQSINENINMVFKDGIDNSNIELICKMLDNDIEMLYKRYEEK